jgi:peroxiredoxin
LTLQVLQERLVEFKTAGATLVAISSNPPDSSLTLSEKHNLQFEVLTDYNYTLARQYGIVYELSGELDTLFQSFGVDLRTLHEAKKAELVLTSTFLIDQDGAIRYAFHDVDHTKRAEPDDILAALGKL